MGRTPLGKLPFPTTLPAELVRELEQEEGADRGEKLLNYIKKIRNSPIPSIDDFHKIKEHEKKITEFEHNLINETIALLNTLAETEQRQKLMAKLESLPDYDKLKEMWHKGIAPYYKDFPKRSLTRTWYQWCEKIAINGEDTYAILEEDYKLNPHKYPPKNEEIQ